MTTEPNPTFDPLEVSFAVVAGIGAAVSIFLLAVIAFSTWLAVLIAVGVN